MRNTHGVETLVGAPGNLAPLIPDDAGRVAVPGRDRADDAAIAVADENFVSMLPLPIVYRAGTQNGHFVTI